MEDDKGAGKYIIVEYLLYFILSTTILIKASRQLASTMICWNHWKYLLKRCSLASWVHNTYTIIAIDRTWFGCSTIASFLALIIDNGLLCDRTNNRSYHAISSILSSNWDIYIWNSVFLITRVAHSERAIVQYQPCYRTSGVVVTWGVAIAPPRVQCTYKIKHNTQLTKHVSNKKQNTKP